MFKSKIDYHVLEKEIGDEYSATHPDLATAAQIRSLRRSKRRSNFVSILFIGISILQGTWILKYHGGNQASSHGFTTEFKSAREAIEQEDYVQRNYSGWWVFDEETQFVRRHVDLSKPQLFGDPNEVAGISRNWDELLNAEFLSLTDEEASAWPHVTPVQPYTSKFIELDVTHSLHCVNHLRKLLSAAYYNDTESSQHLHTPGVPQQFFYDHMNHCLEQLFETVTCHSDLTPIPLVSFIPDSRKATIAIGGSHTCRNFNSVRGWLYDRASERISVNSRGATYKGKGEFTPLN